MQKLLLVKTIAGAGVALAAGAAAAATATPDAAADGLDRATSEAGFEVPVGAEDRTEDDSSAPADTEVTVEETAADTEDVEGVENDGAQGEHGALVSGTAHDSTAAGSERGHEIAAVASEGRSTEGQARAEAARAEAAGPAADDAGSGRP